MIIFLFGQDAYRSWKKLVEITEKYKRTRKSGLALKYFDAKEKSFADLSCELGQSSIFKENKLLVLTNVFLNLKFKKKLFENAETFIKSKDVMVIYEKGKISKKDPLFKFLKKKSKWQEFNVLDDQKLKQWIKKEFAQSGVKIGEKALNKLSDFVGSDLWRMSNEINKLICFKNKDEIKPEDVELLVGPKIESDIFKTIDAIALKNKKKAIKLLDEHLTKGDSPYYLFSMINYQFRNILIVKDLDQRNLSPFYETKLHPFVIKKTFYLAKKFNYPELVKIYKKIFELDIGIKTGKIGPEAALSLLIAEI